MTLHLEVVLAIFDIYAKGIAAGGGDEDKAKDQNIVQANLRRLFELSRGVEECSGSAPTDVEGMGTMTQPGLDNGEFL